MSESGKENFNPTLGGVSPKSTMDSISSNTPKFDAQDQLDRRTKECETAKKLIDTMRVHRERDMATIAELREKVDSLNSDGSQWKSETSKLHEQVSLLREDVKRKELEKKRIAAEKEGVENQLSECQQLLAAQQQQKLVLSNIAEQELAEVRLNNATQVALISTELESLRSRSQTELRKALEERGTLQWQLDKEKEIQAKQTAESEKKHASALASVRSDLAAQLVLMDKLKAEMAALTAKDVDRRKEMQLSQSDANRRISLSESKQVRLEDGIEILRKKLDLAVQTERTLQEEVDALLHQQSTAIERIAAAGVLKDNAEKMARDSVEKSKNLAAKLAATEKLLKQTQARSDSLNSELSKAELLRKSLESSILTTAAAGQQHAIRMCVVTALIVLIVTRMFFA